MLVSGVRKLPGAQSTVLTDDDLVEPSPECANCGDVLARLETPRSWRGKRVCGRCYTKLAADDGIERADGVPVLKCPKCGCRGKVALVRRRGLEALSAWEALSGDWAGAAILGANATNQYMRCRACGRLIGECGPLGVEVWKRRNAWLLPVIVLVGALLLIAAVVLVNGPRR